MKFSRTDDTYVISSNEPFKIFCGVVIAEPGAFLFLCSTLGIGKTSNVIGELVVCVIFIAGGLAIAYDARSTKTVLRKNGLSEFISKHMIGGRITTTNFSSSDISSVHLLMNGDGRSWLSIHMKNMKEEEDLAVGDTGGGRFRFVPRGVSTIHDEAKQISEFLGVPLRTQGIKKSKKE